MSPAFWMSFPDRLSYEYCSCRCCPSSRSRGLGRRCPFPWHKSLDLLANTVVRTKVWNREIVTRVKYKFWDENWKLWLEWSWECGHTTITDVDQNYHASHNPEQGWDNSTLNKTNGSLEQRWTLPALSRKLRWHGMSIRSCPLFTLTRKLCKRRYIRSSKTQLTPKSFVNMPTMFYTQQHPLDSWCMYKSYTPDCHRFP